MMTDTIERQAQYSPLLHRLAIAVAVVIFIMIIAGGLVTSQDAGDSVPDWPLSYGSVYPAQQMVGNVRYEHTHRMIGWGLGLVTIVLAVGLQATQSRRYVRRMGWAALVWVCVLGALGGLRVMLISKPQVQNAVMSLFGGLGVQSVETVRVIVTVIHTALAQSFLCFVAVLSVTLSPAWIDAQAPAASTAARSFRRLGMITVAMILLQLVFGAIRRHTDATLPLVLHLIGAGLVLIHVMLLILRIRMDFASVPALRHTSKCLGRFAVIQIVLGLVSWWVVRNNKPGSSVLPELAGSEFLASLLLTAHLAVGAMILVITVLITVFAFKYLRSVSEQPHAHQPTGAGQVAASS